MMVQVILHRPTNKDYGESIVFSTLKAPQSLDQYDINIIDLSAPSLWHSHNYTARTIDDYLDLKSIQKMVEGKKKSKVVYIFPGNCEYSYAYDRTSRCYNKKDELKNLLLKDECVKTVISYAIYSPNYDFFASQKMIYEPTITKLGSVNYRADFYFKNEYDLTENVALFSEKSEKATTLWCSQVDGVAYTTLNILESKEHLESFINKLFGNLQEEPVPDWISDFSFYDDKQLQLKIDENNNIIENAKNAINNCKAKLNENNRYKSILYNNGNGLVDAVFSILEQILSCDLSKFVDEKKEDFIIKKDTYTLIGEIKGVTSNIKNEHISQVDVHFQEYSDKLEEEGSKENIHQILIINPFRNKPLSERDKVNNKQIALAQRNKCLIITTETLLCLFEKFLSKGISVKECEQLFIEKTGLLSTTDFE